MMMNSVECVVGYKAGSGLGSNIRLCFRCDWRAYFLENGHGPRYECQQPSNAVYSCYMYLPVLPVVMERNEGDDRPLQPAMLSARLRAKRVANHAECVLSIVDDGKEIVKSWAITKTRKNTCRKKSRKNQNTSR